MSFLGRRTGPLYDQLGFAPGGAAGIEGGLRRKPWAGSTDSFQSSIGGAELDDGLDPTREQLRCRPGNPRIDPVIRLS